MKKNIQHGVSTFLLCASLTMMSACTNAQNKNKSNEVSVTSDNAKTKMKPGTRTITYPTGQVAYNSAYLIDGQEVNINGGTYKSSITNQNVFVVVNGGKLNIKNATINKSSDSETNDSFGLNAGIVVIGENSSLTMENCNIETNSKNSDGIYVSNNGKVNISKSDITILKSSSNGITNTFGSKVEASGITIVTSKKDSIPLFNKSDDSMISIKNATLSSQGENSPCVYSNGKATLKNVRGNAKQSQAINMVGNSLTIKKSNFSGNNKNSILLTSSEVTKNDITLKLSKSVIENKSTSALFKIKGTKATIHIEDCTLKNNNETLVEAKNNANVIMNATTQNLSGNFISDNISRIYLSLNESIINGSQIGNITINKK